MQPRLDEITRAQGGARSRQTRIATVGVPAAFGNAVAPIEFVSFIAVKFEDGHYRQRAGPDEPKWG
jgi:hypothetical protein